MEMSQVGFSAHYSSQQVRNAGAYASTELLFSTAWRQHTAPRDTSGTLQEVWKETEAIRSRQTESLP